MTPEVTFSHVLKALSAGAPLDLQESYDNSGLLVGEGDTPVRGALCCLDVSEDVLVEALRLGCNLVISHHPPIFRPLRSLRGDDRASKLVLFAIRNGLGLISMHTNLDSTPGGVSHALGEKLGLMNMQVLSPREGLYSKLVVFVPHSHADALRSALFACGAGVIGGYADCSFNVRGVGTFTSPMKGSPSWGKPGEFSTVDEARIEMAVRNAAVPTVLHRLREVHPYEEPAYDLLPLAGSDGHSGLGVVGDLPQALPSEAFLNYVREILAVPVLRHSQHSGPVRRVALCGGSGGSFVRNAIRAGADVYLTADLKFHDFQEGTEGFMLIDAGHYETERVAVEWLYSSLKGNFTTFAVHRSLVERSPVRYAH